MRVSELAEKIYKLADYPTREKCLSAAVFYKLRQAVQNLYSVSPSSIRPSTAIKRSLPWRSRRTKWRQMQEHLKLSFPGLVFPSRLALLCLIAPATLLIWNNEHYGLELGLFKLIMYSLVLALLTILACTPLARYLPLDCETVGDLTKTVLAKNYAVTAKDRTGSTNEDVLSACDC